MTGEDENGDKCLLLNPETKGWLWLRWLKWILTKYGVRGNQIYLTRDRVQRRTLMNSA